MSVETVYRGYESATIVLTGYNGSVFFSSHGDTVQEPAPGTEPTTEKLTSETEFNHSRTDRTSNHFSLGGWEVNTAAPVNLAQDVMAVIMMRREKPWAEFEESPLLYRVETISYDTDNVHIGVEHMTWALNTMAADNIASEGVKQLFSDKAPKEADSVLTVADAVMIAESTVKEDTIDYDTAERKTTRGPEWDYGQWADFNFDNRPNASEPHYPASDVIEFHYPTLSIGKLKLQLGDPQSNPPYEKDFAGIVLRRGNLQLDRGNILPDWNINKFQHKEFDLEINKHYAETDNKVINFTKPNVPLMLTDTTTKTYPRAEIPVSGEGLHIFADTTEPRPIMIELRRQFTHPRNPWLEMVSSDFTTINRAPQVIDMHHDTFDRDRMPLVPPRMPRDEQVALGKNRTEPEFPAEEIIKTTGSDHPYDYHSHYQKFTRAHNVDEPSRDFEDRRITTHEIHGAPPEPKNSITRKTTENSIYGRDVPRQLDIMMLKELKDVAAPAEPDWVEPAGNCPPIDNTAGRDEPPIPRIQDISSVVFGWAN